MSSEIPHRVDVLVVGAGPGGSAAAAYAADRGHDVLLVDSATFPRDKTCGDGLTPRAVGELDRLGMTGYLDDRPRIDGVHLHGWGAERKVRWPSSQRFPGHGSAVARTELDNDIRGFAQQRGVRMVGGAKAVGVTMDGDRLTRVQLTTAGGVVEVAARDVIVADGVRSSLGKIVGRTWHRDTAYGVAARAYVRSSHAESPWMGSHLELRGPDRELLPGYGWVFPLGNSDDCNGSDGSGLLNVGVGALATAKRPAHMALRPVLEHYARMVREQWGIEGAPYDVTSALLPMGGAVSGVAGRNWMLIGDAAACVNPLNGEGIDYALETGRMAVDLIDARPAGGYTDVWRAELTEHYGLAFSAARRLAGLLTVPRAVPILGRPGIRVPGLMALAVRVMGNLITAEDADLVARAWRGAGHASSRLDTRPPFS